MSQSEPTEAQLKTIGFICKNIGVAFEGSTKEDATRFISDNIEQSKAAVKNGTYPVTKAQWEVISYIGANTGFRFKGNTAHEATVFISRYINYSKNVRNEENRVRFEYLSRKWHVDEWGGTPYRIN